MAPWARRAAFEEYVAARPHWPGAGLDEGLLSLSFSNVLYTENPYSYKKCQ